MGARNEETLSVHSNGEVVATKLLRIAEKARMDPRCRFTSLYHLMNKEHLRECFDSLRKEAATGIDKVTKEEYSEDLEENLENLVERLHKMSYRPQPVRRAYVPKAGGKRRPLGILGIEDKIVHTGLANILGNIYEADFVDASYGFRPNRGCHDALRDLTHSIDKDKVNYIVDVDIKGFFDNISHEWMIKLLSHRIADKRILRLVKRLLRAGVVERGIQRRSERGVPQGGVASPILANIYLHYALDLWFEKRFRRSCTGYTKLIRYADDFVVCFQYRTEAELFLKELRKRLAIFELEIEPTKSKIILFGRFALEKMKRQAGRKPETFDFLGFTHYCSTTRNGKFFCMKRSTSCKRFTAKLKEFKQWLRNSRTCKTADIIKTACAKVRGHIAYYGVTHNSKRVTQYVFMTRALLYKWLNRRGKKGCYSWDRMNRVLKEYRYPHPRLVVHLI